MKLPKGPAIVVIALFTAVLFSACGGGGGSTPASTTTISGKLLSGTVTPVGDIAAKGFKVAAAGEPLVGYQLYCVTFSTPPLSASGTSGSDGSVTVTFDAASATFGCFILDSEGNGVATLIFTNGDATTFSQTVTATGTVDLGTVTVSLSSVAGGTGAAQATAPSGVTIVTTTPSGATCPEGSWFATGIGHSPTCPEGKDTESSVWIVKEPDGTYAISFTTYNAGIYEQCTTGSKSDIPMTFEGSVVSATFPFDFEVPDPCSPSKIATLRVTTNADCTTGEISGEVTNCATCDPAPCNGCGTLTCPLSGTVTKQ
jgi:hypothetical protein